MSRICYAFHPETGEFLGPVDADTSPLEPGVWLYPANTTIDTPPASEAGKAIIRSGDGWARVPDHRGQEWYVGTMPVTVVALGDPLTFDPPLKPRPTEAQPLPPTDADVDVERDRRLPLGVSYLGHLFQTRPFDIDNMTGAAAGALAAIVQGAQPGNLRWADPDADFAWIAADNTDVPMDAHTALGLGQAAMNRRTALIRAGRAIKDGLAAGEITSLTAIAAAFDALT